MDNKSTGKLPLSGLGPNPLGKGFIYHGGLSRVLPLIYVEGKERGPRGGSWGPGGVVIMNKVPRGPAV